MNKQTQQHSATPVATYRPYAELMSRLVICCGGSPSTHRIWMTSSAW